ncbi:MAG: glutamine synthetase family protein [Candidatus Omnitrophota bacterium]
MNGPLKLDELRKLVKNGAVDTIVTVFPDHYGRLMGKRVTAAHFLEYILPQGMEACNYLLSVDMEMNPLSGFEMASWGKGYGDFHGVVDMATLRLIPWLEATALVFADLEWEAGGPVVQSPRAILRRQIDRAKQKGLHPMMGSELEFYLFRDNEDGCGCHGGESHSPSTDYLIDYHILGTTPDEDVIRQIRNGMNGANIPVEFSKGEWGKGQHEINLLYADALEMADRHAVYKNGVKEIAWLNGARATFMAKPEAGAAGSSFHLHVSVCDESGKNNLFWDKRKKTGSTLFRQFLGGLLRYTQECFLFYAPTVNSYKRYLSNSFAPTKIAWGEDNRTTGFRVIGHGSSYRIENRMPGADANPYMAYAAAIAAGLAGIEEELDSGDPYKGNAYQDDSLERVPMGLKEAANHLEQSCMARTAFGDEVVDHYVRLARWECQAFDESVTDWERRRYFERI